MSNTKLITIAQEGLNTLSSTMNDLSVVEKIKDSLIQAGYPSDSFSHIDGLITMYELNIGITISDILREIRKLLGAIIGGDSATTAEVLAKRILLKLIKGQPITQEINDFMSVGGVINDLTTILPDLKISVTRLVNILKQRI